MDVFLLVLRLLLAALLYAFLGAVLLMLWRDLRLGTAQRPTSRARGYLVLLDSQADAAPAAERRVPLQPVTSIGRSPANAVVVDDSYASSHHALLASREGHWWLEDRGSRNGTLLNGQLVEGPTIVAAGDVIRIGETRLRLELGEDEDEPRKAG